MKTSSNHQSQVLNSKHFLPNARPTDAQVLARTGKGKRKAQRGFTLLEIGVAITIIALLAGILLGVVPKLMVGGRVTSATNEFAAASADIKAAAAKKGSATPFTSISTAQFAGVMKGGSVFKTVGSGSTATLTHGLSYYSTGNTVTVASANSGASYEVTINAANNFTCPKFVAGIEDGAQKIVINSTTVKDVSAGTDFDFLVAGTACNLLDDNVYKITQN